MTSEKLKPTPGPWKVASLTPSRVDTPSGSISISWSSNHDNGAREREAEANALLIAEAGTVFHECGLSPRELLGLVEDALAIQSKNYGDGINTHLALADWAEKARAALAKHKEV